MNYGARSVGRTKPPKLSFVLLWRIPVHSPLFIFTSVHIHYFIIQHTIFFMLSLSFLHIILYRLLLLYFSYVVSTTFFCMSFFCFYSLIHRHFRRYSSKVNSVLDFLHYLPRDVYSFRGRLLTFTSQLSTRINFTF